MAGLILDPWQADVMDVMLAVRPDGKWACFETGVIVPRQNGKGAVLEARALAGLFLFGERLIMWSAHEYKTAMVGFRRVQDLIDSQPELRALVRKVINTNGEEGIELITGQRLRFLARSKGSGRGFSADTNLWDEAYALTDEQKAAQMPTLSARPNPQIVYASSPPLDAATGEPLFALRERGEAGGDPDLGWFDWGQLPSVNHDDPAVWAASNPALGIRITTETVGRERRSMSREAFGRERLGIWPVTAGTAVISPQLWADLASPEADRPADVAFVVDVTPNRDHATIAMCGRLASGALLVGVVEHGEGTDWVVPRLTELRQRWNPVAVGLDIAGPAASMLLALGEAGFAVPDNSDEPQRGDLLVMSARETAQAWGMFVDHARQRQMLHLDDPPLNMALAGAKTRFLADGQAWARKQSDIDISPLVAVTGALYVFLSRIDAIDDGPFEPAAFYV